MKNKKLWPFSLSHSRVSIQHLDIIRTFTGWFRNVQFMVKDKIFPIVKTSWKQHGKFSLFHIIGIVCIKLYWMAENLMCCSYYLNIRKKILCKYLLKMDFFLICPRSSRLEQCSLFHSLATWHNASFLFTLQQYIKSLQQSICSFYCCYIFLDNKTHNDFLPTLRGWSWFKKIWIFCGGGRILIQIVIKFLTYNNL